LIEAARDGGAVRVERVDGSYMALETMARVGHHEDIPMAIAAE